MNDIRKLLHFLIPYKKLAIFSLAMLLAMVFLDLAIPRLVEQLIDQGIKQKNMAVVIQTALLMLGFSVLSTAAAVLNSNSSVKIGESVARDLREALFIKIQGFSYSNLDQFPTGLLMVRLTSDTSAVQRITQVSLRIGTRAPLSMIGSIVLMFVTSPILAATMIPLLLISAVAIVFFSVRMEPFFRLVQQKLDKLSMILQENISGARLVKSFVRAGHEESRFAKANAELTNGTVKVMQYMAAMSPVLTVLINLGMVLVIWFGGIQAVSGQLTMGQIVAFTNYLIATMVPLVMMTQLSNTWANGLVSAKRLNEILDTKSEITQAKAARPLPEPAGSSLDFSAVKFHYHTDAATAILTGINLEAKTGQTIAILGATGSGKSTLINLIPRFYDVSGGSLSIDDLNVKVIQENSLRRHISVVPQETILFSGSVADNLRYGRPAASEAEIIAAAKIAQAHDFIVSLPNGYKSRVEERGSNFSGGQKQRIAIARALVANPAILILDDSTSSVDTETEALIQAALADSQKGCMCFLVAQRISTVLNADKIIVLDKGRIVAEGKHAQLLKNSQVYREIYDSQLGGSADE